MATYHPILGAGVGSELRAYVQLAMRRTASITRYALILLDPTSTPQIRVLISKYNKSVSLSILWRRTNSLPYLKNSNPASNPLKCLKMPLKTVTSELRKGHLDTMENYIDVISAGLPGRG